MQLIPQALQRPWIRTAAVISIASLVLVGSASAAVTLNANIDTTGSLTVDGLVQLGDGSTTFDVDTTNGIIDADDFDINATQQLGLYGYEDVFLGMYDATGVFNMFLEVGDSPPASAADGDDLAMKVEDDVFIVSDNVDVSATAGAGAITLNGLVDIPVNLTVGASGTLIDTIIVASLTDGTSGWVPDGAATSFTVTASAASVNASNSNITVSLSSNATPTVCGVSTMATGVSFTVVCTAAPDNGARLHYSIVTLDE